VPSLHKHCLPPLDTDFFVQLQRTGDGGYADSILETMRSFFGVRQEVSLERVFCTLEHGEKLAGLGCFKGDPQELVDQYRSDRFILYKGLQRVFIDSLLEFNGEDHSHRNCIYHNALSKSLTSKDVVISFNYDCLMDASLEQTWQNKWDPKSAYGFTLLDNGPGMKYTIDIEAKAPPTTKAP
jgi:hypothetical protein